MDGGADRVLFCIEWQSHTFEEFMVSVVYCDAWCKYAPQRWDSCSTALKLPLRV
jgi:hypothetical protein